MSLVSKEVTSFRRYIEKSFNDYFLLNPQVYFNATLQGCLLDKA